MSFGSNNHLNEESLGNYKLLFEILERIVFEIKEYSFFNVTLCMDKTFNRSVGSVFHLGLKSLNPTVRVAAKSFTTVRVAFTTSTTIHHRRMCYFILEIILCTNFILK